MDEKVNNYLQKLRIPQKDICNKLRGMILTNFPKIEETVMSEGLWYEGKFYIASFKDHVNLGVNVNGLSKKDLTHFEGKGKSLRHLKYYSLDDINEKQLHALMQLVYKKTNCTCKINWKSR